MLLVGVDVGGTFTDLVIYDENTGLIEVDKTLSTPDDPTEGVLHCLQLKNIDLTQVRRIVHGTTIATNAVVERKGAKTAVLVTKGHKDVIELGMLGRYKPGGLFNPYWQRDEPYIPRRRRLEIDERILPDGKVLRELRDEDVLAAAEVLKREQVEAVAVCFLNSYVSKSHEQRVGELLRKHLPETVAVSVSADTIPEHREYERWATTVLNAYVAPRLRQYLRRLSARLHGEGYHGDVFYMTSSGGILTEATAADYPIRFVLSGPAGAVNAGVFLGETVGLRNIITCDMGGTSTDVCLLRELKPATVTERIFEGVPVKTPQLDIVTIGAGGGSIAWIDAEGGLKVGPRSAGSAPGPVCYGLGGVEVTVTDANLVLGRLGVASLAGGRMKLDLANAVAALERLGERINVNDIYRLADGIIKIAVNNMCGAVRTLSVEQGQDPRDFALVPMGGAGPMHVIPVAEELGMSRIVVPCNPGHASAFGMLTTDLKHDYVRTYVSQVLKADVSRIRGLLLEMADEGRTALLGEGIERSNIDISYSADMRYVGQSWQLSVPVSLDDETTDMATAFHRVYHQVYGYSRVEMPVELVYLRVIAAARVEKPRVGKRVDSAQLRATPRKEERQVYFDGSFVKTPVYDRQSLAPGTLIDGPAIVEEMGATSVLFPGWQASVDDYANLVFERK